jgi:hypothetical protein
VVSLSGAFNFTTLLQDDREGKLNKNFSKNIPQALGCTLETTCNTPEKEAWAIRWSPSAQVTSTNCSSGWLIFNSETELMPLDQPKAMTGALEANSCKVTKEIVPGTKHAFEYWATVKKTIFAFIRAT